jgi:protein ImuB
VACDDVARAAGVRAGQTVAEARSRLVPREAEVVAHDPARDAAALRALAAWAGRRFAPAVALDPPDGLLLDVTGCERLFGGEARLVGLLRGALGRLGFSSRAAVAGTFGCAWALARHAGEAALSRACGEEREALAPLPVAALRVPPATVLALAEVGVVRVSQVASLPRATLDARFGEGLLRRLDEATGAAPETIVPFRPRAPLEVERAFEGPTSDFVSVRTAARRLVHDLAEALAREGRGVVVLDVLAERPDAASHRETIRFSRATADARHVAAILDPRLERWHLEPGVDRLRLRATRARRLRVEQGRVWDGPVPVSGTVEAGIDREVAETVDALASRCGEAGVLGADLVEAHLPERAFRFRRPLDPPARGRGTPPARATPAPRPSVLYEPPEPADVLAPVPDGPPARLRWRDETRLVRRARGPERLAPPWWEGPVADARAQGFRDYFRVEDERGRWLWVFRDALSRRWFVHGEWA